MIKTQNGLIQYSEEEIREMENYTKSDEYKRVRIEELKEELKATDYISCKIAEGAATREEYADELAQRQRIRDEINRLEAEVR